MDLITEKLGEVAVVTVNGEHLDASDADEFRRVMAPVLTANSKVALDMSRLQFVDSAGLGALLSCLRKLISAGGDLKLYGLSKAVRTAFEITRMHRIFDIYATKEEAIQAFLSG